MSDQFDKIIEELKDTRKDINDCLELLAIASTVRKDCSDELNEIIQAALPFVSQYSHSAMLPQDAWVCEVKAKDIRRLIAAISKVTDGDLQ